MRTSALAGTRLALGTILLIGTSGLLFLEAAAYRYNVPDIRLIAVRPIAYRDLDGDHDGYPDTGETGRLVITVQNIGPPLTGVIATLSSTDPNIDCLISRSMLVGDLATGQIVTVGSLDPAQPGFTFKVGDALQTVSALDPATVELCLRFAASGPDWFGGFSDPACVRLAADLDQAPAASQTFVAGPDGVSPSPDDGVILENFDVDRDGDGKFTIDDTFRMTDEGTGLTGHGFYLRGADLSGPANVAGVACGGFHTVADGNSWCHLDVNFPMDWHFHCPPGATNCPNLETGACVGGCNYSSIRPLALSPPNSLHMGAHYAPGPTGSDPHASTTHLASLQAFVSAPINLTANPRPGDLDLSMFHIARLNDDQGYGAGRNGGQCSDCADVQVQVDHDPDPAVDSWGFWDKLAPYQNTYDHRAMAYSALSFNYCLFTPTDTGTAPPAPRGVHETMCSAAGAWSRCGYDRGTTSGSTGLCYGPGRLDPSGLGVWVETKFDLARYLGQRVRFRWIAGTWSPGFRPGETYHSAFPGSPDAQFDDGWWLDDIKVTGAITRQVSPAIDTRPAPGGSCPATPCVDADGDGYMAPSSPPCPAGLPLDCDDTNPNTFPGAWEVNDGHDNECPGDPGYGIVDEYSQLVTVDYFSNLPPPDYYLSFGVPQAGAWDYQVARSDRPTFSANCAVSVSGSSYFLIPEMPPQGTAYFYLLRPRRPFVGSWGQDSAGHEITGICGL